MKKIYRKDLINLIFDVMNGYDNHKKMLFGKKGNIYFYEFDVPVIRASHYKDLHSFDQVQLCYGITKTEIKGILSSLREPICARYDENKTKICGDTV